jgi:hypothetical protein
MKSHGELDVYIYVFLISALVGGEWSASRPILLTPGERAPGTHWIGGWVGPSTDLDDVKKRKFLTLPGSNSDFSVVQPVANRYTDCTNSQISYFKFLTFNQDNLNVTTCRLQTDNEPSIKIFGNNGNK